jgi:hypothetical protein
VPGKRRRHQPHARLACLVSHREQVGDAGGQNRRLGVDREVKLLGRTLEDEARQRHAERRIGALERIRGRG